MPHEFFTGIPEPTWWNGPDDRPMDSTHGQPLPHQCVVCGQVEYGYQRRQLHEAITGHFGWKIPVEVSK